MHSLIPCACVLAALAQDKGVCSTLLSMVAELWMRQLFILTSGFLMSFWWNRNCQTSSLDSMQKPRGILSLTDSGMDDLESFQAWSEEIKIEMSTDKPSST